MTSNLGQSSYLFGANTVFVEELYEKYLLDPNSIDQSWRSYFDSLGLLANSNKNPKRAARIIGIIHEEDQKKQSEKQEKAANLAPDQVSKLAKVHMLIRAYQTRGHFRCHLDPLDIEQIKDKALLNLDIEHYGFTEQNLDEEIDLLGTFQAIGKIKLRDLVAHLERTYSHHIGTEYMHIQSLEQKEWIEAKLYEAAYETQFSQDEKKSILQGLVEVEGFEQFLHIKFPGTKRFSVEGGENSITAVDGVIKQSVNLGVEEIVLGMPHRGRLNMLTKVMRKPYYAMLSEFMGNLAYPEELEISGDVKYHLGTSSDVEINGRKVHLSLNPNPSHLEAVNPVVVGKVRAKQDFKGDLERKRTMAILLHGDAAFAGQGVVAETLSLSDLDAYRTGGTIHVIVNNQIGFTTSPRKARTSRYPTEVAKIVEAPIFHVNGDDAEAVVKVAKIAAEFQQTFAKDVVIDVICYRLHGHNETDEPMFTNPLMYRVIAERRTPVDIYAAKLISEGAVTGEEYEQMKFRFREFLDKELKAAENYKPNQADWLLGKWQGLTSDRTSKFKNKEKTEVELKELKRLGMSLTEKPKDFNINSKISRLLDQRRLMIETGEAIDWGMGEALGFASLLAEGIRLRITGQDCCRGTFSHRHAVIYDQTNENKYIPLNNLGGKQAEFEIHDSNLSEFAVLGFEYGYSTVEPKSLVLWEAQFGDFANGAQTVFDQFIASAEIKWLRMSGLVMLLPHGYEGQGPEHSSARLERFLQLCGNDNMQVVNITTPANFFHALRRQVHRDFRKPLVVMTPKSLLRHKLATSKLSDFSKNTQFKMVIEETHKLGKVTRVVISSGKVYYDLLETRQANKIDNVALVRLEQLYPFPAKELTEVLAKYQGAEVIWCQEEPENMGGWTFVDRRIEQVLVDLGAKNSRPRFVGRTISASPAVGYGKIHTKEQEQLVAQALGLKKVK